MQDSYFADARDWEGLSIQRHYCAGLDIASTFHCCYLPPHLIPAEDANMPDGGQVINFDADQTGLEALVQKLLDRQVQEVVMESTGIYWYGVYRVLVRHGLSVWVVNPRHAKNISGRKTDEADARWLCRLHTYGLLRASFVPKEECWELRDLMRQRDALIKDRARYALKMTKELDQMNVKLHKMISDLTGKTGMAILRFIAQGVPAPDTDWTSFHSRLLKVASQDFNRSLQGDYSKYGCFLLRQHLESYDRISEQIEQLDHYVERLLFAQVEGVEEPELEQQRAAQNDTGFIRPLRGKNGRLLSSAASKNAPLFDQVYYLNTLWGVDMTTLPGMESQTILNIYAEVGLDLKAQFPSAAHFVSWLQLAPNPKISGGKVLGKKKVTSVNRVHTLFRNCAFGLSNSKGYFGQFYRSIKMRSNGKTANKALACKLAKIFYVMVTTQTPFDENRHLMNEQRQALQLKRLQKQARKQGFNLVPIAS
jgi:transposase